MKKQSVMKEKRKPIKLYYGRHIAMTHNIVVVQQTVFLSFIIIIIISIFKFMNVFWNSQYFKNSGIILKLMNVFKICKKNIFMNMYKFLLFLKFRTF